MKTYKQIKVGDIINILPFKTLTAVNTRDKIAEVMETLGLVIGKEVHTMLNGKDIRILTLYSRKIVGDNITETFLFSNDGTSATFYYENGMLYAFRAITLTARSMHEVSTLLYSYKDGINSYGVGLDPKASDIHLTLNDKSIKVNRYFFNLFRDSWGAIKRFCRVA